MASLQDVRGAYLAGLLLAETADLDRVTDRNKPKVELVRRWLVSILEREQLPAVERAAAGDALGRLGDPRFPADAWYLPDKPLLGFVEVPAGTFLMGSNTERDAKSFDEELLQHEVMLQTYYMACYPVTVGQFRAFVEESGYKPTNPDSPKGVENHPVVFVTWHDALAYCKWLTETLQAWEGTPESMATLLQEGEGGGSAWRVSLPSEAEWEKAARGTDGKIYPWGDEADPNGANYNKTGIGTTSAVGCFPSGADLYGCLDMAGNVWEWTRSLWGQDWQEPDFKYPYNESDGRENLEAGNDMHRVLRGGAFGDADGYVRYAYRDGYDPNCRSRSIGFRVVLSPSSSGL